MQTTLAENSQRKSNNVFARKNMSIFCPLAQNMMLIKRVKVEVGEGAGISGMDCIRVIITARLLGLVITTEVIIITD